jgi:hypothetical protein
MLNASRSGQSAGDRATDPGLARTDLDPDESNNFGPDAPNTREDGPPRGQAALKAPPPEPPSAVLDHGDFAPDGT